MTSARAARMGTRGALALLVLGAALLRRSELGPPALWADDAWVALISRHAWRDIWFTSLTSVGFRAMIGVAIAPFPEATLAAQALPFLFGLAVIPSTYAVARRLDLHRPAALFAAGLVAASPLLATYSTRVKQYTGDALFTLAIAASVRWVLRIPSSAGRWGTLAAVSCAAIVFSSQLALAVGPAVAVALAGSWRARRTAVRAAVPAVAVIALFTGAWHMVIIAPVMRPSLVEFWSGHYVVLGQGAARAGQSLGRGLGGLLAGTIGPAPIAMTGAAALIAVGLAGRPATGGALLLPVAGAVAAAAARLAPIGERPDAYLAPLLALAIAVGLDTLLRPDRRRMVGRAPAVARYAAAALGAVGLVAGAAERAHPMPYPREDVKSLARIWADRRGPEDHTFVHGTARHTFALYSRAPVVTVRAGRRLPFATIDDPAISLLRRRAPARRPAYYTRTVRAVAGGGTQRIWTVAVYERRGDASALAAAVAALGFALEERWTTDGEAELALYVRSPAP